MKRLGLGVSQVDWTITFDVVSKIRVSLCKDTAQHRTPFEGRDVHQSQPCRAIIPETTLIRFHTEFSTTQPTHYRGTSLIRNCTPP